MLDFSYPTDTKTLLDNLPSAPSPKVSDKYMFVDTRRVVEDMRDLGFEVANFRRPKYRTKDGAFGLHEVDFRLPADIKKGDGEASRVLFLNTYDGSRRAQIVSGIIRFICTNGLICGDIQQNEKFLHLGNYEDELLTQIKTSGENAARTFGKIDQYKTITLSKSEYRDLSIKAKELRFPAAEQKEGKGLDVDPSYLLMPRRPQDKFKDLWTTWNVLQENLLRGGIPGRDVRGNVRVTRPLSQIQKSNDLNRGLWNLLEEYAA